MKNHNDDSCGRCNHAKTLQKQQQIKYLNTVAGNPAIYGEKESQDAKQELEVIKNE